MYAFRLYIVGGTPGAAATSKQVQQLMHDRFNASAELTVTDLLEHPELAERDGIYATPTLVKVQPDPVRKVVGDLSDLDKVWRGLGLNGKSPDLGSGAETPSPDSGKPAETQREPGD